MYYTVYEKIKGILTLLKTVKLSKGELSMTYDEAAINRNYMKL